MEYTYLNNRIIKYIGADDFEKSLGTPFRKLLSTHKFDEALQYIKSSNLLFDDETMEQIEKHILSYKYAC